MMRAGGIWSSGMVSSIRDGDVGDLATRETRNDNPRKVIGKSAPDQSGFNFIIDLAPMFLVGLALGGCLLLAGPLVGDAFALGLDRGHAIALRLLGRLPRARLG